MWCLKFVFHLFCMNLILVEPGEEEEEEVCPSSGCWHVTWWPQISAIVFTHSTNYDYYLQRRGRSDATLRRDLILQPGVLAASEDPNSNNLIWAYWCRFVGPLSSGGWDDSRTEYPEDDVTLWSTGFRCWCCDWDWILFWSTDIRWRSQLKHHKHLKQCLI